MAKTKNEALTTDQLRHFIALEDVPCLADFLDGEKPFKSKEGPSYVKDVSDDYCDRLDRLFAVEKNSLVRQDFQRRDLSLVTTTKGRTVLNDGDDQTEIENPNIPTISYLCVAQLMRPPGSRKPLRREDSFNAFCKGEIKVVDFTLDTTCKSKPKEKGFTKIKTWDDQSNWHRASTILLRYKNESWLVGQDEGTYFGVVLADHPQTISAAFESLIPKELRKKKDIQRQGEWFLVPVKEQKVPVVEFVTGAENTLLPKTEADSNSHSLVADKIRICGQHCEKGLTPGQVFACNGGIYHNEHEKVDYSGWVTFVRNTALRSVSQEGVD